MAVIWIQLNIGSICTPSIHNIQQLWFRSWLGYKLDIAFSGILHLPLLIIRPVEGILLDIGIGLIALLSVDILSGTLLADIVHSSNCYRCWIFIRLNWHGCRLSLFVIPEIASLTLGTLCIQRHSLRIVINIVGSAVHCSHTADLILTVMLEGIVFSCLFGCV